jgi:sulfur-oxidizing protein SoxA
MAALTAYMAFTSRGKPFDIKIRTIRARSPPTRTARNISIPARQLNFSCATCHAEPGRAIRAECWRPR